MILDFPSKKLKALYKSKSENKIVEDCLKHFVDGPKPKLYLPEFSFSTEETKAGELIAR